jgi:hypothetical protein
MVGADLSRPHADVPRTLLTAIYRNEGTVNRVLHRFRLMNEVAKILDGATKGLGTHR